jgi:hypothetical protein
MSERPLLIERNFAALLFARQQNARVQSIAVNNCGVSTMRHASFFSTNIGSSTPASSQTRPTRKSLFASLLEALHHSRRLQAQRVLAQHRHLIARYEPADVKTNAGGEKDVGC